ncbi:hypothetical protein [Vibrio gallaecicus]|uniref:hypothetical protein n=2 Tax=Vibrio gallaecicus TaxID=552386 RepID=UPI0025B4EE6A|nr:hypothetical protein [Vibrio gallaecicus]MDN3616296.1 hypothetical protein [Vibrio gallaecicus]
MRKRLLLCLLPIGLLPMFADATYITSSNQQLCKNLSIKNAIDDKQYPTKVCYSPSAPIVKDKKYIRELGAYWTITPPKDKDGNYIRFKGNVKLNRTDDELYTSIYINQGLQPPEKASSNGYNFEFVPHSSDPKRWIASFSMMAIYADDDDYLGGDEQRASLLINGELKRELEVTFNPLLKESYCFIKVDDSSGGFIFNDKPPVSSTYAGFNVGAMATKQNPVTLSFEHKFNNRSKYFEPYFEDYKILNFGFPDNKTGKNQSILIQSEFYRSSVRIAPIINLNRSDLLAGEYKMVTTIRCGV